MASNVISIEFAANEIRVATSQLHGKNVRIRSAFAIPRDSDDTDQLMGEKLKSALNENGVSRGDAIVIVGRSEVEIREIKVPPAPDNEIPALVRFKSKSEFASVSDNSVIDFVSLSGSDTTEREVLACALPGKTLESIQSVVETTGLKVKHFLLRPFATANLLTNEIDHDGVNLVVAPNGQEFDLTLFHNGKLILTRSVRSNAHGNLEALAKQLTLEANRTMASATKRIGNKSVEKIILFDDNNGMATVGDSLADDLQTTVLSVDPFSKLTLKGSLPENTERYSSPIGALMQQGLGRKHEIDFLNPRQPVVEGNQHSKKILAAGLVAALVFVAGFLAWMSLRTQSQKIDSLTQRLSNLRLENQGMGDVKGVDQVIGEVEKVDNWIAQAPNWLDELDALANRTLDPDFVIVDRFMGSVTSKSPYANIKGRIKEHATNTDLQLQLAGRPYRVEGQGSSKTAKSRDYPITMEHNLRMEVDLGKTQEKMNQIALAALSSYEVADEDSESDEQSESVDQP